MAETHQKQSASINAATKRGYDGTVARIAGNLLSGDTGDWIVGGSRRIDAVREAVATARDIVAETKRTEPSADVMSSEAIPASVIFRRFGVQLPSPCRPVGGK